MIDFDCMDDWAPELAAALVRCVPAPAASKIRNAAPRYIEDARDLLFELANRDEVIAATLTWIQSTTLAGYHGTRLSDAELASIRAHGLIPLKAENRRARLLRALSSHPRWAEVEDSLDSVIQTHGQGNRAGRRENQVHLTLSKCGLTYGFNHYLTHGAEFDQHVAHALLAQEGEDLLRADGKARVVKVGVPGAVALDAAHPHFSVDDLRARGESPNIVHQFLKAWSYRLAHADFQCRRLEVDCGMVFDTTVPPDWIIEVDTLAD